MNTRFLLALAFAAGGSLACGDDPIGPDGGTTFVSSLVPAGGATDVDPAAAIVLTFTHPMRTDAELYVALREGDVTGPEVPGTRVWSTDHVRLTFTPDVPLKSRTPYTLHLGGNMRDARGHLIGFDHCVQQHQGQWATHQMMGSGTMGGSMNGPGWQHPNGTYGMVFTFTTR